MKMIVRQFSGLGNQLFQYAAARYYGPRYGAEVEMAIDPPERAHSHGDPRPFLMSKFRIVLPYRVMDRRDQVALTRRRDLRAVAAAVNALTGTQAYFEPFALRHTFHEDLPLDGTKRVVYLYGYWQTYALVTAVEPLLREELRFVDEPSGRTAELLGEMSEVESAVSLHIRRGDYTLAAEGNKALPMGYYERAIAHYRERLGRPRFYVFSDDIGFARANLPAGIDAVYVDHNKDDTSYEDLCLMAGCKHHVIANSSFSWWGAWLNGKPGKTVYCPKYWTLTEDSYYPGLVGPGWTLDGVDCRADPRG